jgi:hypothetical protein
MPWRWGHGNDPKGTAAMYESNAPLVMLWTVATTGLVAAVVIKAAALFTGFAAALPLQ